MSHGRAFAASWHDLWHLCQLYNCSCHTYLPISIPAEGATPRSFAAAVRDDMARISGAVKAEVDYSDVQIHVHARSLGLHPPDFLCSDAVAVCGGLQCVLEGMTRFAHDSGRADNESGVSSPLVVEAAEEHGSENVSNGKANLRTFLEAWGSSIHRD